MPTHLVLFRIKSVYTEVAVPYSVRQIGRQYPIKVWIQSMPHEESLRCSPTPTSQRHRACTVSSTAFAPKKSRRRTCRAEYCLHCCNSQTKPTESISAKFLPSQQVHEDAIHHRCLLFYSANTPVGQPWTPQRHCPRYHPPHRSRSSFHPRRLRCRTRVPAPQSAPVPCFYRHQTSSFFTFVFRPRKCAERDTVCVIVQ